MGRGGFSVVYKALDTTLRNRPVALKVLHPHLVAEDPNFVQRFQREAGMSANLIHPNIVTIYDMGEVEGAYYIAMGYLPGRLLNRIIDEEGPLPLDKVARLTEQVASALDYAHSRGVIHRDIKPSNIIVDDEGHATLTDFGLVRAAEKTTLTLTGQVLGTPEYMSPEQAELSEEEDLDHRSDLYSLGVVIYEMCTGTVPFRSRTPLAVLRAHVDKEPPRPTEINPALAQEVEALLLKALAKDKSERFGTAMEMVQGLWDVVREAEENEQRRVRLQELHSDGKEAEAQGDWVQAMAYALRMAQIDPRNEDGTKLLQRVEKAAEADRGARTAAEESLRAEQRAREVAEEELKVERGARQEVEEALKAEQEARTAIEETLRASEERIKDLEDSLSKELEKRDKATSVYEQASQLANAGRYQAALRKMDETMRSILPRLAPLSGVAAQAGMGIAAREGGSRETPRPILMYAALVIVIVSAVVALWSGQRIVAAATRAPSEAASVESPRASESIGFVETYVRSTQMPTRTRPPATTTATRHPALPPTATPTPEPTAAPQPEIPNYGGIAAECDEVDGRCEAVLSSRDIAIAYWNHKTNSWVAIEMRGGTPPNPDHIKIYLSADAQESPGTFNPNQRFVLTGVRQSGRLEVEDVVSGSRFWIDPDSAFAPAIEFQPPTPPPPAPSVPSAEAPVDTGFDYGIQVSRISPTNLNHMKALGLRWTKLQIRWANIEPQQGALAWGVVDEAAGEAGRAGYRLLLSVTDIPAWARGGRTEGDGPPDDPLDLGNFLEAIAERYCGTVHAIEVWPEQNVVVGWNTGRGISAGEYVNLLKAAYNRIKEACPGMIVISGAPVPTGISDGVTAIDDVEYLRQMYEAGLKNYCNAVGVHPSGFDNPPDAEWRTWSDDGGFNGHRSFFFLGTIEAYREVMVAHGDGGKMLWATDFGWASIENIASSPNPGWGYAADVSEQQQADYLVRAFEIAKASGYMGAMFVWNLDFSIERGGEWEGSKFSILRPDGTRRLAYDALAAIPK